MPAQILAQQLQAENFDNISQEFSYSSSVWHPLGNVSKNARTIDISQALNNMQFHRFVLIPSYNLLHEMRN